VARYAAFLRAVNLGGNRRVSSAELRSCFEDAGLEEVGTFRTSGNVVFAAGRESRARLAKRIEGALEQALGYEVPIFLRSAAEVDAIAAERPFPAKLVEASAGKLQVALLPGKPTAQRRKRALALQTDDDRLAFGDCELYWLPSAGTMESSLDRKQLDELVGPTTVRTKGTIEHLAAKFFAG
jgi:uncharacterized protein (DUF1697 family)